MHKLQIYGKIPPPYGGVSVHLKRLTHYLSNNNSKYEFIQSNKNKSNQDSLLNFIKFFIKNLNFSIKIIHIHGNITSFKKIILLSLMLFFRKKVIITIHNNRFEQIFKNLNNPGKIIARIFYRNISHLISVNPDTDFLFINNSKISVIPAFIPPTSEEIDINQLPKIFHKIRKKHKFLITANAFKISFYNNEDLYGIDLSVELMKRLVDKGYKDVGFVYVIPDIGDYEYFKKMQKFLKIYNLEDNFHFYIKPVAYPAVINMCDLFIRPTNTDGYGVSIAEAISLKKPAIASDVCKRPEGTILFENRNVEDLYSKTIQVIDNYDEEKKKIKNIEFDNNAEKILEVYKKLLD